MNRFVIMVREEYDMYSPLVPHPILTCLSRGEIVTAMTDFAEVVREGGFSGPAKLDLFGGGVVFYPLDLVDVFSRCLTIPQVLTEDEWFDEYANVDFNREQFTQ
jgi:hypothetical protein